MFCYVMPCTVDYGQNAHNEQCAHSAIGSRRNGPGVYHDGNEAGSGLYDHQIVQNSKKNGSLTSNEGKER